MAAVAPNSSSASAMSSRGHLVFRLSVAFVMAVTLLARTGDAIDLMKLLEQKQQRNIKRGGIYTTLLYNITLAKWQYNDTLLYCC